MDDDAANDSNIATETGRYGEGLPISRNILGRVCVMINIIVRHDLQGKKEGSAINRKAGKITL
jgi:hypothetical protein